MIREKEERRLIANRNRWGMEGGKRKYMGNREEMYEEWEEERRCGVARKERWMK